jgi:hypothetical protein
MSRSYARAPEVCLLPELAAHARSDYDSSRALAVLIAVSAHGVRPSACGSHDRNAIADETASAANASGLVQTALSKVTRRSTSDSRRASARRVTPDRVLPLIVTNVNASPAAAHEVRRSTARGIGRRITASQARRNQFVVVLLQLANLISEVSRQRGRLDTRQCRSRSTGAQPRRGQPRLGFTAGRESGPDWSWSSSRFLPE